MHFSQHYETVDNDTFDIISKINSRDIYESVIIDCIRYKSEVMLSEVLRNENFKDFKKLLKIDSKLREMLIEGAIEVKNIGIIKMVLNIFSIEYLEEYDELIKNKDLVYNNERLVNKKKDIDYIIENFEDLTRVPLLVYEECINVMEKYMDEKLSEDNKKYLGRAVRAVIEELYIVNEEISDMDDNMYEEWYNWRHLGNYDLYDSYKIKMQFELWNQFKSYYESIKIEEECEDYDY